MQSKKGFELHIVALPSDVRYFDLHYDGLMRAAASSSIMSSSLRNVHEEDISQQEVVGQRQLVASALLQPTNIGLLPSEMPLLSGTPARVGFLHFLPTSEAQYLAATGSTSPSVQQMTSHWGSLQGFSNSPASLPLPARVICMSNSPCLPSCSCTCHPYEQFPCLPSSSCTCYLYEE